MKVNYIYDRWKHHGVHSGYDIVIPSPAHEIKACFYRENGWAAPIMNFLARPFVFHRARMSHYSPKRFYAELAGFCSLVLHRQSILHVLEAEFGYRYLGLLNEFRSNRIIATFHLPPERIELELQTFKHLSRLSAAIAVSQSQIKFLENHIEPSRIFHIPIGVDSEFFTPRETPLPTDSLKCVFVGKHMRDTETLFKVIDYVNSNANNIEFVLISEDIDPTIFAGNRRVTCHKWIDDELLLQIYQESAFLVLPLLNATAVITLLEAAACGLPSIVTRVGGVPEYVDQTCAMLIEPERPREMAEAIIALANDPQKQKELGVQARKRALNFRKENIIEQMRKTYMSVLNV